MYKLKLLYYGVLLLTIRADCYSFDDYQANTAAILDLLSNKDSNKHLVNTVVDCMGKTFTSNGKSNDFLRCVNDLMHTDDLTNTDDIRFIIGNYAARASKMLFKCYIKRDDLIYCLRAFGDCLPLLFRNLFGYDVHKRDCRRLLNLPKYDKDDDYYRGDDDEMLDEYEYDVDYDEYDDEYGDYDDTYDYDEDDETEDEDMDGMISDRKRARKQRSSRGADSRGPPEKSDAAAAAAASAASEFSAKSETKSPSEKLTEESAGETESHQSKASESGESIEVISDQE
ncbi:hypothetical protein MACK_003371 [Theileria orientalis]|uniref:Uncharacterized protein n=1 Tax=Theileria orientalis TaxID=68886 RepID=A0A976SIL9_THEOR|nr:hypothetical protein MACK_003371 [Theileria orientalis]